MVGAVGVELRFQSDAGVLLLKELAAVDLKRGEVRVQLHLHAAGTRAAGALAVQREAVVDAALDGLSLREVQQSGGFHRRAAGEQRRVYGQDGRSVDPEAGVQHRGRAAQIEIQVRRGGKVGVRVTVALKVDAHPVARDRIGDSDGQIAGVAVVAVRGEQTEAHGAVPADLGVPDAAVIAVFAAVQLVFALVCGQLVGLAVQGEVRTTDTVRIAADNGAEIGIAVQILLRRFKAQRDRTAVEAEVDHRCAQRHHADGKPLRGDRVAVIAEKI